LGFVPQFWSRARTRKRDHICITNDDILQWSRCMNIDFIISVYGIVFVFIYKKIYFIQ
jgi:hypothetical protein